MIEMLTAATSEADSAEYAVKDILKQLAKAPPLRKNSVGIISACASFFENGILRQVMDALHIDAVATLTASSSVFGGNDDESLCLSVLTSDEARFRIETTSPLDNPGRSYHEVFEQSIANARTAGEPALALAYFPLQEFVDDNEFSVPLCEVFGAADLPVFGTLSMYLPPNADSKRVTPQVLTHFSCSGYSAPVEHAALIFIYGDVNPQFNVTFLPQSRAHPQKAVITKSNGCVLEEINSIPATEYLSSVGFQDTNRVVGVNSAPIMLDFGDGSAPVSRMVKAVNTDTGALLLSSVAPENARITFGIFDSQSVTATARGALSLLRENGGAALIYSCLSRQLILSWDARAEIDAAGEILTQPYLFAYSGGEICPMPDKNGRLVNRYHNMSLVTLSLS